MLWCPASVSITGCCAASYYRVSSHFLGDINGLFSLLQVRYDDLQVNRLDRVSPWEIEPSGSVSAPGGFVVPGAKRIRVGFPVTKPDFPVLKGLFVFLFCLIVFILIPAGCLVAPLRVLTSLHFL